MPRQEFENKLAQLHEELAQMGARIDEILQATATVLQNMDIQAAKSIASKDVEINAMEKSLEHSCINLIALQQPLARDLRVITSVLKIITDMERIADQCADICEILATAPDRQGLMPSSAMLKMFDKAREMFAGALRAYIQKDVDAAAAICAADDEVDGLFSDVVLEIANQLAGSTQVLAQVDFMFIAKYLERIGDHATNIAEWAIFNETGFHPDLNTQPLQEHGVGI